MPFIIGNYIPENKNLVHSVAYVYGIGLPKSKIICKKAGFGLDSRGADLETSNGKNLINIIKTEFLPIGSDLHRLEKEKIRRLCSITAYRGIRHKKGLPVRGQRTHTNAKKRFHLKNTENYNEKSK